jgi:hypothetical protein
VSAEPKKVENSGCFWIMVAYPVIGAFYILYVLLTPDLEAKKFLKDCHDQQVRSRGALWFTDLTEQGQFDVVRFCQNAIKEFHKSRK